MAFLHPALCAIRPYYAGDCWHSSSETGQSCGKGESAPWESVSRFSLAGESALDTSEVVFTRRCIARRCNGYCSWPCCASSCVVSQPLRCAPFLGVYRRLLNGRCCEGEGGWPALEFWRGRAGGVEELFKKRLRTPLISLAARLGEQGAFGDGRMHCLLWCHGERSSRRRL